LRTEYDNFGAAVSPNGKWLAYTSNETKQNEVYVRPFPSVDSARWTISVNGGAEARWSRSGRQLFFRTPSGEMMVVQVAAGDVFQPNTPVKLFTNPHFVSDPFHQTYDASSDDKGFIMVRSSEKNAQTLGVVINWGTEIGRLSSRK
jgi:Tol biopolymer transport system component